MKCGRRASPTPAGGGVVSVNSYLGLIEFRFTGVKQAGMRAMINYVFGHDQIWQTSGQTS